MLSALFDSKYHQLRFDILLIMLFISMITWIENNNKVQIITEIFFIALFFLILLISKSFLYKKTLLSKNLVPTILSSGDKMLFLSLFLFFGVEKGLIIILVGLLSAFIWAKENKLFIRIEGKKARLIPLYPFMAFSLILIGGVING